MSFVRKLTSPITVSRRPMNAARNRRCFDALDDAFGFFVEP
jgi:hypothetical protein